MERKKIVVAEESLGWEVVMGKERGAETRKKKKEASFFNRNYKSHNGE